METLSFDEVGGTGGFYIEITYLQKYSLGANGSISISMVGGPEKGEFGCPTEWVTVKHKITLR